MLRIGVVWWGARPTRQMAHGALITRTEAGSALVDHAFPSSAGVPDSVREEAFHSLRAVLAIVDAVERR
ncbi:hypothetical protein C5E08_14530 [Rathayibacter iranicus]|uniref:Uncharacterized protein n=2 Tax=Rathayibacter iranicus TaxID=59737 RepID=A0AAD1ENY5_9MICO|nr:hypothetical protein [Rathayibacter iranicus]AZZ56999.1 hypothetical protein C7V51_14775 [Rathayibacter iranicus]PPI41923.1 hypothetical protein C5E09_13630 [Rathayibacter iranicus]PPI57663.1 hypothetical protein C5E08_14530 [Rathayibacter iranicus]PPI68643.1 hypothetical protein C5E01_13585 [Rathayibacter iranicus]PWJ66688.1 hypothetical protein B0H03_101139 [Rathayibacter iranicus NCPPB 2253 = VKM Ac-1602]